MAMLSPQVPPPPGIVEPTVVEPALLSWRVAIVCEGAPPAVIAVVQPLSELSYAGASTAPEAPIRASFRIDASGRPLDIAAVGNSYRFAYNDLGPALAASRFAPAARSGCVATFTPVRTPVAQADLAAVIGYTVFPSSSRPPRNFLDRLRPRGSTCFEPAPAVLNRAFPDFKAVPQAAATTSWSMVGFDIDADGHPVRVRYVAGTGNAMLDAVSITAVEQSRFEKGARTGCLYPYYRRGDPLPAPEITIAKNWRPEGSTCPADPPHWTRPPVYSFPDAYRRRGVEGWAVVQYDVAPWGEIGNARVIAAEPAAAFGESAIAVLRGASRPASAGYVGCVDRVKFAVRAPVAHPTPNQVSADTIVDD